MYLNFIKVRINKTIKNKSGIIPINKTTERKEECGSKRESGLLTTVSPYSWPKFKGPVPNRTSIKVGL